MVRTSDTVNQKLGLYSLVRKCSNSLMARTSVYVWRGRVDILNCSIGCCSECHVTTLPHKAAGDELKWMALHPIWSYIINGGITKCPDAAVHYRTILRVSHCMYSADFMKCTVCLFIKQYFLSIYIKRLSRFDYDST